jgi:acyl-CoA thioesterase-1
LKNKLLIFFKTLLISLILISCSENNKLENVNKILLFGDSLMSGYGLKENQALSIILENDLKETGYNIRVINGSVSGDTSGDGLYRIEEYISGGDVDLIVLGLGANDMLRRINPDQTESNLRKIIEIIKTKNIKIILAGMKASPTNGLAYKKKFDDIFPKLAEEYDLTLIPFLLKKVALNPKLNQSDGIHPNFEGAKVISETIKESIINFD